MQSFTAKFEHHQRWQKLRDGGSTSHSSDHPATRYSAGELTELLVLGQSWIWETDAEHRLIYISEEMETLTGIRVKNCLSRIRHRLFVEPAGTSPALQAHLDDLENQRPFHDFIFRPSGKAQNQMRVSSSGTPRFDKDGRFMGYIGISHALSDAAFAYCGPVAASDQSRHPEPVMRKILYSEMPPSAPLPDALRTKRILIIDADQDRRDSLLAPLKQRGFDAAAVENAQTALMLAGALHQKGQPIDLVIISCALLRQDCLNIAGVIDENWPGKPPIKLLLSPDNFPAHHAQAWPLNPSELYHQVAGALQADSHDHETAVSSQQQAANAALPRIDVLIAEDNPVNQLVMMQILAHTGLSYQIVANGQLAIDAFHDMRPGLVLMDTGMPKLDGFAATRAIRAMTAAGGDRVPIIAVTANAAGEDRESCLKAGMNDHLSKPLNPETLLTKIAQWMPPRFSKTA